MKWTFLVTIGWAGNLAAQAPAVQPSAITVSPAMAERYLAMTDSAAGATSDTDIGRWHQRINASYDSVAAVLTWLRDQDHGEESLRMLVNLDRYWNDMSDLVSRYARALALPSVQNPTWIRARALLAASRDAHRIKDQTKVRAWAQDAMRVSAQLGDSVGIGRAYLRLMFAALRDNDHAGLRALADTGEIFCVHRNNACDAEFFNMLGESFRARARYDSAVIYYERADALVPPGLGYIHNLGFAYLGAGRIDAAREQFTNGLRRAVASGNRLYAAFLLAGIASADAVDQKTTEASRIFGVSDALLEQLRATADPADAIEYGRYRARARTKLGSAAFDRAVATGRGYSADSVMNALVSGPRK